MSELSHINTKGTANMVDVSAKPIQLRTAIAKGSIALASETLAKVKENDLKKGDVLSVARIAGIQAAKATPSLIPLCHTLSLSKVDIDFAYTLSGIDVTCTTKCAGQTGVEMEALTGVSVALLTIYDMCKAVDKRMIISNICLLEKTKV